MNNPPMRKKWRDIVRTALIAEGFKERSLAENDGGILWDFIPSYYVADIVTSLWVFANYYPDELATLQRFVEVLGKRDIAATLIPGTPRQGAYVRIMKPYDDRTDVERELAAEIDRWIKEWHAD